MGDAIEENVWEGENEIDLSKEYKSDDEFVDEASGSGTEEAPLLSSKESKKRKRFEVLKQKKKGMPVTDSNFVESGKPDAVVEVKAMTVSDMLSEIIKNQPGDLNQNQSEEYNVNDFFYPDLVESSTTKSNKKVCPYTRALSANLPSYKKLLLNNTANKEDYGCPLLLVLCSSAIQCTHVIKSISTKLIKPKIAKLFAKHFKIEEQLESLSKEYFPIAIGTPNRVSKLIELGALSLRRCMIVLVDITEDSKKFNILSLNEVKNDFYRLLYQQIHPEKSHLKIALIKQ